MTPTLSEFDQLPYLTADRPGLGGRIKACPEDFRVEEIPLYEPAGDGPHIYLTLRRSGLTTRQVVDELARRFGLSTGAIGYAGLKDKEAVTTQTFSLESPLGENEVRAIMADGPWETLAVSRHRNKLKVGHLLGNRFLVVLSEPGGSLEQALALAEELRAGGVPNYFGPQRFGQEGDNAAVGLELLRSNRKPGRNWRDKFLLSALQSLIYNHYLALRIKRCLFETVLTGDVCKKYATGGLFVSEDGAVETERLRAGELSHTGPIFGAKMKAASGPAAELEAEALAELELSPAEAARAGVGDRRLGRLLIPDLAVAEVENGLAFSFALPKGAYATSVMREFIK
jgi:Uncharacterized conserved protein